MVSSMLVDGLAGDQLSILCLLSTDTLQCFVCNSLYVQM